MVDHTVVSDLFNLNISDRTESRLRQEYIGYQQLFDIQAPSIKKFIETQAGNIAEALLQELHQVKIDLPDQVVCVNELGETHLEPVTAEFRRHALGGVLTRLAHPETTVALRQKFVELENSSHQAVATSAVLLHHAVAIHMAHKMLPEGRRVRYASENDDTIPSIPVNNEIDRDSSSPDVFAAESTSVDQNLTDQEDMPVPYVKAARWFYLPQWVAFDDKGSLLARNLPEAESMINSLMKYSLILNLVTGLAPYMVADEEYQRKYYGITGQLVNQGRALARYEMKEIIHTIQLRVASHTLDRGLSLSLPYFNDQTLKIESFNFEVIPVGRVMFVPAFVVLAVRAQAAKVARQSQLSHSTRRQILLELSTIERAFLRS